MQSYSNGTRTTELGAPVGTVALGGGGGDHRCFTDVSESKYRDVPRVLGLHAGMQNVDFTCNGVREKPAVAKPVKSASPVMGSCPELPESTRSLRPAPASW
jgi:hypothetical protein